MNSLKLRYIITLLAIIVVSFVILYIFASRNRLIIEGTISTCDDMTVYLERMEGSERKVIDSIEICDKGKFRFVIDNAEQSPILYELLCGWERIPVLGQRGERIEIDAIGSVLLNYSIKGSNESELLRSFIQPYTKGTRVLRKLASQYAEARNDQDRSREIAKEYSEKYKEVKQAQVSFIVTNKESLTALYAMKQRLQGDEYMIDAKSDLIYMEMLEEALSIDYPSSPYVTLLQEQTASLRHHIELLNTIRVANYPELKMRDMFDKERSLSSMLGSVILLDFWAPEMAESKRLNLELKEVYNAIDDDLFEIYQVGITRSKANWVEAIQEQRLPWISVSDLNGDRSQSLGLYNVSSIPSNILIDREGTIVGRNLYGDELKTKIQSLLR